MAQQSQLSGTEMDAARKVMAGKGKKLHVHEAHVRHAKNGGYIIRHDLADKNGNPPTDGQRGSEEYTAGSPEEMLAHMQEHMGGGAPQQQPGDDEEEDEEQPPQ